MFAVESAFDQWVRLAGALRVVANRDGVDEQTVYTTEGGAYSMTELYPGTYTLIVSAPSLFVVEGLHRTVTTVNHETAFKSVGIVIHCSKSSPLAPCSTKAAPTKMVLVWDRLPYDNLDLRLSFGQVGGASRCDTFSGRPRCGGAEWSGTSDRWRCDAPRCTSNVLQRLVGDGGNTATCETRIEALITLGLFPIERDACAEVASQFPLEAECGPCAPSPTAQPALAAGFARAEVIALTSIQSQGPYLLSVDAPLRLCHGYQLAAAGGGTVDCIGNCATGRGYCRALGDACAPCQLWLGATPGFDAGSGPGGDAEPNQQDLCPPGEAQGGPIPYSVEWDERQAQGSCATLPSTLVVSDCAEADTAACSEFVDTQGWACGCPTDVNKEGRCDADCQVSLGVFLSGGRRLAPSGDALAAAAGVVGAKEIAETEEAVGIVASAARRKLAHARAAQTQPCSDVVWAATDPAVYVVQNGEVHSVAVPGPSIASAPLDHALTLCLAASVPGQLSVVPITNAGATANDGCVCQPTWEYVGSTYTNECSTTFDSPEREWCYVQPAACPTGVVSTNKDCIGCIYQFCDAPQSETVARPFTILDDAYFAQAEQQPTCELVNVVAQGANQAALHEQAPCAPLTTTLCLNTWYTYSVSEASACPVVHGSLRISAADGATPELPRLTAVGGDVIIEGNAVVVSLTMRNLVGVGGFRLTNSYNLANLTLPALTTVGGAAVDAASVHNGALVVHTPSVVAYTQLQALVDAVGSGAKLVLANGTYHGGGDAVVSIGKDIIIIAQYRGGAVLDGEGSRRVILISGGAVVLDGLVVTNGHHPGGGGLRIDGGSVVIQFCDIASNTAFPAASSSYHKQPTSSLLSSKQASKQASNHFTIEGGGGMHAGGGSFVLVSSSRIRGNALRQCSDECASASDGVCDENASPWSGLPWCSWGTDCSDCGPRRYGYGAGARVTGVGTRVTFSDCDINANDGAVGSGVSTEEGSLVTFTSVHIHGNTGYNGAGLSIGTTGWRDAAPTTVSIANSRIESNHADYGGGLYVYNEPTVTIESTQIVSNSAVYIGGGVELSYSKTVTISDSVFMSNFAGFHGGAMYARTDSQVRAVTISSTQFINNSATFGYAALFVVNGLVTVNGCSSFDCIDEPDTTSGGWYSYRNPTLPACIGTGPYSWQDGVLNIVPPTVAC